VSRASGLPLFTENPRRRVFSKTLIQLVAPLSHRNVVRSFKALLHRAGLPVTVRLYDLRHTCATLLLCRNVHPKYVQELLGHASIVLTLDTYSHVLPGMGGGAADAMEEALG
jgi:integrase